MEFEFNDIDDAELAQLELTSEELELCQLWAEKHRLIEEIKKIQDNLVILQTKASNSLEAYWNASASASVERDYRLGRVKTIRV